MKWSKRKLNVLISLIVTVCILTACGSTSSPTSTPSNNPQNNQPEKVTLLLDWSWWPGQTPIIVAKEKGFYEKEGLDVQIQQGQGSGTTAVAVGQGTSELGHINQTATATAISKGVPVTAIATYQQKGATSIVFLDGTNIKTPKDLIGKRIGSTPSGSDAQVLPAFLAANGLSKTDVNIVNMQGDAKLAALIQGQTDGISGDSYYYLANLTGKGKTGNSLLFADYGANVIGFGFIANNDFLKQHPDVVKRFLKATFEGFDYTYSHMDEAIQIFLDTTKLPNSKEFVKENLLGLKELWVSKDTEGKPFGWNSDQNWNDTLNILQKYGGLTNRNQTSGYYTNEFLPNQ